MPLYYFQCQECGKQERHLLEPRQVASFKTCGECGGKLKRTPKPAVPLHKEIIDNGLMQKSVERYTDVEEICAGRSKVDRAHADWEQSMSQQMDDSIFDLPEGD